MFAALDERRATPGLAAQAACEAALTALVGDAAGARFVAQCLELDPVEVRRIVGPLDVSQARVTIRSYLPTITEV